MSGFLSFPFSVVCFGMKEKWLAGWLEVREEAKT